jgi:autotransporter-associated beta strand protein
MPIARSVAGASHALRGIQNFLRAGAMLLLLLSGLSTTFAASATWKCNPVSGDWNTAANWTPNTVPNGPADRAIFGFSNTTSVFLPPGGETATEVNAIEINRIVFNGGGSAYTITASAAAVSSMLTISGVGIINNSGLPQNFVTANAEPGGTIVFVNSATAGRSTIFTNNRTGGIFFYDFATAGNATFSNLGATNSVDGPAFLIFSDDSTAENGIFTNTGGAGGGTIGGQIYLDGSSTAAHATFTNEGSGDNHSSTGGTVQFFDSSTANDAMFINDGGADSGLYGGGSTQFNDYSTAANATLVANGSSVGGNGGAIFFTADSAGGTARVAVFDNGHLDISYHGARWVTIGSLEGTGEVFLGANSLVAGSNNLSTVFCGVISDDGQGGSLAKVGTGKLFLTNANTYTGGTTINDGKLVVDNRSGSGTGSGAVQVNAGRLGGKGTIAGAVIVGKGCGPGAVLSPGKTGTESGTLTIQRTLRFNSDGTYKVALNSDTARADEVVAKGVTINSGAQFCFADSGASVLPPGTVFTVINNICAKPIRGTFANLGDGSTFTVGRNTFQVSYQGGDGNDLTLTILP